MESEEERGTTFTFPFPLEQASEKGVVRMNLQHQDNLGLREFLNLNKTEFENQLLAEAVNVKEIMDEVKNIGNIDFLNNARKLVQLIMEEREWEIVNFAQQEGKLWAMHSDLNLAVKLEWFQAIRRTLWNFLYNYERLGDKPLNRENFFSPEKKINISLNTFLRHFFMSFTTYKEDLIKSHREKI